MSNEFGWTNEFEGQIVAHLIREKEFFLKFSPSIKEDQIFVMITLAMRCEERNSVKAQLYEWMGATLAEDY